MTSNNEKICPICKKEIRSDANIHDFCALCGMGISSESTQTPNYKSQHGKIRFCCYKCYSIYKKHISNIYKNYNAK